MTDHNNTVCFSKRLGHFIQDDHTNQKLSLRKTRGVFVLDAWVVPYAKAKTGSLEIVKGGKKTMVKVNRLDNQGFSRPGP